MITLTTVLVLGALVSFIVAAMGKCPVWVGGILLTLAVGLIVLPR